MQEWKDLEMYLFVKGTTIGSACNDLKVLKLNQLRGVCSNTALGVSKVAAAGPDLLHVKGSLEMGACVSGRGWPEE